MTAPVTAPTLRALTAAPGFARLPAQTQALLTRLVGGQNNDVSKPARKAMTALLKTPPFQGGTATAQARRLAAFVTEQKWLPSTVSAEQGAFAMARATYALAGPEPVAAYPFASGEAEAQKYSLEIEGHRITLFMPVKVTKGLSQHSAKEIAKAIAALPPASRALLHEVKVEPDANPEDAAMKISLKDPDFASYMVAEAPKIWVFATREGERTQDGADGTFVHEVGHFLSRLNWGNDDDARWEPWKAAMRSDVLSTSKYANVNMSEDFSEAFQLYTQVKGTAVEAELRSLYPARFALIDALLRS